MTKEYLVATLELDQPDDYGVTERDRLNQVFEATGVIPERLEIKTPPEEIAELLEAFFEIRTGEGLVMANIFCYCRLYRREFSTIELKFLKNMEAAVSGWLRKKDAEKRREMKQSGNKKTANFGGPHRRR